jgi:crotonobetainyl-CoA:carnitine CoA-transferase CaiB-like acyl-CoA transferase
VNVAKVNDTGEAADHPQLAAIGGVLEFAMNGQPVKAVASPFALEGAPAAPDRPPPAVGADRDSILADLGFDPAEVAALAAEGAFGSGGPGRTRDPGTSSP